MVLAGAANTAERLLVDRADRVVDAQIGAIRTRLDPVQGHLELIAALAANGRLDVNSPVDMREALWVMMTEVPPISSVSFATFDLKLERVIRRPDGSVLRDSIPLVDLPRGLERFRELQTSHRTFWGTLFWSDVQHQPVINVRTPIRRVDDAFIGGLIATVAVGDLSYLISEASQGSAGRYFVPGRQGQGAGASPAGRCARARPHRRARAADHQGGSTIPCSPTSGTPRSATSGSIGRWAISAMSSKPRGRRWVFVYRELRRYGPEPWLIGQYFPLEDATSDLDRLINGAIVGGATLAVAAILALLIGLSMARSIRTITSAAESMERLEFDKPFHRGSRAARDRRCRPQPGQGARRPEMVRRLCAAPAGLPADGAGRGCGALAPAHGDGDVHRYRRVHAAGRGTCPSRRPPTCSIIILHCSAPA